MQKIRLRYSKLGRARFTSHRDFGRAFERALRRAHIPMAYSSGFNPHPRISYANASPTGAATMAEYLEIGLWEVCDPEKLADALNAVLPPGFRIDGAVAATPGALADELEASRWEVRWPVPEEQALADAVAAFVVAEEVEVQRMMKNGLRTFDARGPVVHLELLAPDERGWAGIDLVVRHVAPLVRPEDVLSAMETVAGLPRPVGASYLRLAQGRLADGVVHNPF